MHQHRVWLAEERGKLPADVRQLGAASSHGNAHTPESSASRTVCSGQGRPLPPLHVARTSAASPVCPVSGPDQDAAAARARSLSDGRRRESLGDPARHRHHGLRRAHAASRSDEDVYWTNVTSGRRRHGRRGARRHAARLRCELDSGYDAGSDRASRLATLLTRAGRANGSNPSTGPTFPSPTARPPVSGRRDRATATSGCTAPDGKLGWQQVTKGAFDVQRLLGSVSRTTARPMRHQASGEDPRQLHLFAAKLDGSEVRAGDARERGTHRAELSPDQQWAYVVWSNHRGRDRTPACRARDQHEHNTLPQYRPAAGLRAAATAAVPDQGRDDTVLYGQPALPPNLAEGQEVSCAALPRLRRPPRAARDRPVARRNAVDGCSRSQARAMSCAGSTTAAHRIAALAFEQVLYRHGISACSRSNT